MEFAAASLKFFYKPTEQHAFTYGKIENLGNFIVFFQVETFS